MRGGVDAQGVQRGVIEGPGVRGRLFGDLGQVALRLPAQRVSRLRPAASFTAGHDPPSQLAGCGVQAACRDHRCWQRSRIGAQGGLGLDRAGHHEVRGSGGMVGPPNAGEVTGLEPVVARITVGVGLAWAALLIASTKPWSVLGAK